MDDDVVLHVAPATKEPVPELTEAFIVPKRMMVKLNVSEWHMAAIPIHLDSIIQSTSLEGTFLINDSYPSIQVGFSRRISQRNSMK